MKIMHVSRASAVCHGLCFALAGHATGCIADGGAGADDGVVTSAITIDVNAAYAIVGVQSNKCVGAVAASLSPVVLEIETCTGTASQRFHPEAVDSGFFRLRNELSGLCMDVNGASLSAGATVIQFFCGTGLNQQWSFTDVATGVERIRARHSGLVLDVAGQATDDGSVLDQWTSTNGANQQFRLVTAVAAIVAR